MSEQVQSPFRVEESAAAKQELLGGPPMQKKKHKKRKASNGRLKKLWRRATTQSKGITSRKEWNEMLELHSDWKTSHQDNPDVSDDPMMGSLPGPAVILSKEPSQDFTNMKNWQATEGSDHRDIILNLIFRQSSSDGAGDGIQKKKKRKLGASGREPMRQSSLINAPTLPSWSNIRNLSGMGGLAVIEICIEDCDPGSPCPLMPSERVKDVTDGKKSPWTTLFGNTNIDTNSDSKVQRSITACKVKLFQGNKHPRCLSDVLMFLPPPVASSEHDTKKQSVDVIDAIYDLRLTPKQMRYEGYPFISGQEESSTDDNKESVENKISAYSKSDVDEMSTDVALDLIKTVSVEVSFGDDDEHVVDHTECEHYVKTFSRNKDASPRRPKIFAIDCEMVQTKANMELARVSVIEYVEGNGNEGDEEKNILVLDELVKPRRDVLDYLTHYSGVTAKMLLDVKTRIESIQLLLLSLIHEEDVIIGHSAENDLRALRLVHNNIVDTSVVFRGDNGRKYSLKHLSNVLLQRQIQNGCGSSGHCSREDAEASLVLALRRAKHGSSFRLKESVKHQNVLDVFQKSKGGDHTSDGNSSESSFAERNERSSVCIGPNDWLTGRSVGNGSQHLLSCESILSSMAMAVPSWLASKKPSRAGMLWAKLICEGCREGFKNELKKQDEIIDSLVTNVSTDTPILVIFQRNYLKANALTLQRKAATNPKATCVWSACQEEEWKQYMSSCRNCEALWIGSSCQQQTKS
mmetsp:Transcript_14325/g.24354  ORF Transcript_14325/g.24354 Transcript_14325/m.24354 type:complete len:747 (-) Transcript_14325:1206-3446(-)